ncbi:phosphogluconate dehydrogenase (NAD(+)-dependent, decarboxylating) [Pajaroellobacter abortibovis]|uniref:6-phosphogluconate dehydrogenase (Decarboxylating) n=1 Tax=Pajaroellobacter abortibovis TaxID=1882918 RepID=A0A1L6MX02_9BACT|nr:decarboxylating 6-phosphogluconate dehydrogenase [Pajaroellobacter abortibovis]APS00080.1 6-phosphogluconate dehydrogenase (decarboxylating) [Pajaroellobacter abortibovis]
MRIGMIGLGKMGANMVRRLLNKGYQVVVYDQQPSAIQLCEKEGAIAATSLQDVVAQLTLPRCVWVMVPSGEATEKTIHDVSLSLSASDIVIDGGNSYFRDTIRRARELSSRGIHLLDAGTSGGICGLQNGYCLMVGGEVSAYQHLIPIFAALAPSEGFAHVGPAGAGHFVKMVHNGIEYAMMQAYAEGFEILKKSEFGFDLESIAHLWNQGSVIRSWLLELAHAAFAKDPELHLVKGYVEDSGEGRWTVQEAIHESVPAPTIANALFARFASREEDAFSLRLLAALRNEFGGHAVKKNEKGAI